MSERPLSMSFWLSFADSSGHLGVAIVEVTEEEATDQIEWVKSRNIHGIVNEGADYLAAAMNKAHEMACNPGGSIHAYSIPLDALPDVPRNRLMQKAELKERGLI